MKNYNYCLKSIYNNKERQFYLKILDENENAYLVKPYPNQNQNIKQEIFWLNKDLIYKQKLYKISNLPIKQLSIFDLWKGV